MSRPRVLIVDDDSDVAELLAASLPHAEFDVEVSNLPADALVRAAALPPSIALLDVDMPGMNGFELRDRLRAIPGLAKLPVIFVTGAESPIEIEIARVLGADRLLIKPVPRNELRRDVRAALGLVRTAEGPLGEQLDRVLFSVAENAETGILTATRAATSKRIVFQDGKIVFAASNDPRDLIGQALLRTGFVSESDLVEAFAMQDASTPPRLKSALAAMRKVTPEQSQKVFESKIRESVLDLFLWPDGNARYVAGGVDDAEMPFPLSLAVQPIRAEGLKRRRRWVEVRQVLPESDIAFERAGEWPPGFPKSGGDKLLAEAVGRGDTLAQILVAFRGQDYAISVRIADLVRRGTLAVVAPKGFTIPEPAASPTRVDAVSEMPSGEFTGSMAIADVPIAEPPPAPPATPAPSAAWADPFEDAMALLRDGKPGEARLRLLEIAERDPTNPLVQSRIVEAESDLEMNARGAGIRDELKLRLGIPVNQLVGKTLTAPEAFLLSRFAGGPMQVGNMVMICPFPPWEVLTILARFVAEGTLKKSD